MVSTRLLRSGIGALVLGLLASTAACTADSSEGEPAAGDENDLTSVTARSRTLEFVGTVYVEPSASADAILQAVRAQTQTAFGPLRTTDMAVNSRELKEVDPATFAKRTVKVVDTSAAGGAAREMLEVKYTYKDDAVVGLSLARRSSVPLAVCSCSLISGSLLRRRTKVPSGRVAAAVFPTSEPLVPHCARRSQLLRVAQRVFERLSSVIPEHSVGQGVTAHPANATDQAIA